MTIILFLIDTSASMSQEAFVNGVHKTYLDIAKGAVETFLKYRQRTQDFMGDRYMLLTFEDPPCNIKAGWKENHATFMNELKNLQSNGLSSVGEALKSAFDLLNLNRMQSGIDTYGQGRCPFYLEPSIIILITDGGRYSNRNGVNSELVLPLNINSPGAKLTKEPFRWDQRLFSLILRMPGHKGDERIEGKVPHDDSPLEKMCEVTGGRSYKVKTQYVLNQCIESLVQKAQPGVVIHFDQLLTKELKDGEIQDLMFQNTKKMIYVHKIPALKQFPIGYWPIPESYWPDVKMTSLPARDAHPRIKIISPCQDEPQIVRNFPIDKYELEASPLTLQILSKKDPNKVWPLIVINSNGGNMHDTMSQYRMHQTGVNDMPFGYLKANSTLTVVHFYALPYNYQFLLPLISDLVHKLNLNPTSEWITKFTTYVKNIPQYYCPFLRKALSMINIPYQLLQYILPESLDSYLSPTVANQLKQMKNVAKSEQENLCLRVFKQLKLPKMPYHQHETVKQNCGQQLKTTDLVRHPMLRDTFQKIHSEISSFENNPVVVPTVMNIQSTKNYRNPYDIPRRDLIDEISRMRDNFFKLPTCNITLMSKDAGHSLPIAEMGNYQEYLKRRITPLRELEPTNVRQHMFGNPYKRDKHMVMVDEADISDITSDTSSPSNNKIPNPIKKDIRFSRKRKAGPIKKDFIYKRARYDFGFPLSPGLPSRPSDISTDTEDSDAASEFSMDSDEETRLEFNESSDYDYRVNGHATEFNLTQFDSLNDSGIEGSMPQCISPATPRQLPSMMPSMTRFNVHSLDQLPPIQHMQNYPVPHHFQQPPIGSVPILPHSIPINGDISLQIPAIGSPMVQPQPLVPTSPTTPPPPLPSVSIASTSSSTSAAIPIPSRPNHNDLNDVQNISKILQSSIHNGSSTISTNHNNNNNNSSNNNNNNNSSNNHSNDKRMFGDSASGLITNHKESTGRDGAHKNNNDAKNNDEKQHRRKVTTRRKQKSTNVTSPIPCAAVSSTTTSKPSQHIHTNGLINNSPEKLNNCLSSANLTNGDDDATKNALDGEQLEKLKNENMDARSLVFKEIRKLGRDYSGLYQQLSKVKGNFDMRFNFIQMCVDEANRFRRKHMATCIQEWWENSLEHMSKSKT